jgi:hypothetical protein
LGTTAEDGYLVIPKRDFDVNCERRINFQILQKGEPQTPVDQGLEWLDDIRKECDWWRLGLERTDVNQLMVAYFKDCLCFLPKEKSHQWYLELARPYQLQEAIDYAQGFYATLKGTVWLDDGKSRKPAAGAVVRVVDPKDNKTWETRQRMPSKANSPIPIQALNSTRTLLSSARRRATWTWISAVPSTGCMSIPSIGSAWSRTSGLPVRWSCM